jgi:predicted transcriptional regulator
MLISSRRRKYNMSVKDYVNKILEQKRNTEGEPVKFTISLNPYNMRRLDFMANKLDVARSTLARDLLLQSFVELERILDLVEVDSEATERFLEQLDPDDENTDYSTEILTPYGKIVRNVLDEKQKSRTSN